MENYDNNACFHLSARKNFVDLEMYQKIETACKQVALVELTFKRPPFMKLSFVHVLDMTIIEINENNKMRKINNRKLFGVSFENEKEFIDLYSFRSIKN